LTTRHFRHRHDPRDPNHVIASACSGIYETSNAGDSWTKVQGIPSQSRRTRAIVQHPSIPGLVFAGTTEGFWRSERGGKADSWMVTTLKTARGKFDRYSSVAAQTIYIGTNNYGVMISNDGGKILYLPTADTAADCQRDRFPIAKCQTECMPQRLIQPRRRISFCVH